MSTREERSERSALEREARKKVRAEKDFYTHLATFVIVNAMLVAINVMTSPGYFWAVWPLLGWGVGLASHFVQTFGLFGLMSGAWEERKVREYMLQHQHGMTAAEVRQLMRDELETKPERPIGIDRLVERIENLEAIVTSVDWEHVERRLPDKTLDENRREVLSDEAEKRSRDIARRVR